MDGNQTTTATEAGTPAPLKLNITKTIQVGLAFFTICIFWQIYDSLMPLFLRSFDMQTGLIGLVMACDNILALVMLPAMGRLSDRTHSKWGKRIPYILIGSVLAASTLMLLNYAHNQEILWLLLLSTAFLLAFMCLYRTPAVSLMPDVTPKPLRSKANAIINIMGSVGGVIALVLMLAPLKLLVKEEVGLTDYNEPIYMVQKGNWVLLIIVAVLMVAAAVFMAFTVKENKLVEEKKKALEAAGIDEDEGDKTTAQIKGTGLSKAEFKSYILILASVFLWFFGYNAATTFFSTFSYDKLDGNFSLPMLVGNVAAFIMYVPSNIIGAKIGRRKTILIGIGMVALGLLIGALLVAFLPTGKDSPLTYIMYPVFILVGAGWATINVHSYVMAVELAKKGNTGLFTGLYYTFSMGAQALTPIIAGLLYDVSYKFLFFYSAIFVAASAVTMFFVRHGNAKPAIAQSKLEMLDVDG